MKLKYKKMIVIVSMCTMGIGLVTFSMSRPDKNNSTKVEESAGDIVAFNEESEADLDKSNFSIAATTPSVTPIPTESPKVELATTAKIADENPLEKDAHKDINKLIKKYLKAKLSGDKKAFEPLVSDVSLLDMADLERKNKYIDEYKNITCYTKKGAEEGSYIVYAYHEVKFESIDTLAPAMNEFYVKTNENGEPYIYLGSIDKETENYLNEVRESEDVMDIIYNVNDKLKSAIEKDDALKEFCLKLEESAKDVSMNQ